MRKKYLAIILFSLPLLVISILFFLQSNKADAFLSNNLIDEVVFDNTNSMSAAQINAFLNNFAESCISTNNGFSAPDPTGYSPSGGFTYGGNVSAGQIIYDAAQVYGINPQVLLTTIEKEQSLVSGGNGCSTLGYAAAAGYGCPDGGTTYNYSGVDLYTLKGTVYTSVSGTCVNSINKVGFAQQIILAAWLLKFGEQRSTGDIGWDVQLSNFPEPGDSWNNSDDPQTCYSGPMVQGTWQVCSGGSASYYDGYTTIDGVSTQIANGATAALYWYTPHFAGNENFDSIFTSWFGSPLNSYYLVKSTSSPDIYLLDGNSQTIYLVPSYNLLDAFGFQNTPVITLNNLSSFITGGTLNTLIQDKTTNDIYLVDSGVRYYISNSTTCTNWGLSCFDSNVVMGLGDDVVNSIPFAGTLQALQDNGGVVYLMQNGDKEPVISPTELKNLGYSWGNVVPISSYNSTQPLGPIQIPNGTAIQFKSGVNIYLYDNGVYNLIPDPNLISAWGLNVINDAPVSSFDTTAPTTVNVLSNFATDGAHTYLVDQGIKKDITPGLSSWATVSTPITNFAPVALANLPAEPTTPLIRTTSGDIYVMQSGQKRYVPTLNDLIGLGFNPNQLTGISNYAASTLPDGNIDLSDSTLFQVSGSPNIYLVNRQISTLVASPNDFPAFNFNWGGVEQLGSNALTAYPDQSTLSVLVKNNNGQEFVASNGYLYAFSNKILNDWGLSGVTAIALSNQNVSKLSNSYMTDFARTPNGTIYYGQNGYANPISSLSKFTSLGGNVSNTVNVPYNFITLCPVGVEM